MNFKPPTPSAPSAPQSLPGGSAAPTPQSLDAAYASDAAKIKDEYNPKGTSGKSGAGGAPSGKSTGGRNGGKGASGGSSGSAGAPVPVPAALQGIDAKIGSAKNDLGWGFEGAKAANQADSSQAAAEIGVSKTKSGTMVSNKQLGNVVAGTAATDIAIGALNTTTPAAKLVDGVGNLLGGDNLGSKAQDAALKGIGVDPKQVRRAEGYNGQKK
jgi:hypothetical protein